MNLRTMSNEVYTKLASIPCAETHTDEFTSCVCSGTDRLFPTLSYPCPGCDAYGETMIGGVLIAEGHDESCPKRRPYPPDLERLLSVVTNLEMWWEMWKTDRVTMDEGLYRARLHCSDDETDDSFVGWGCSYTEAVSEAILKSVTKRALQD